MGFRIVLALSNDHAHKWQKDPLLGDKIWMAAQKATYNRQDRDYEFHYGEIIEQVHADAQTLIVADGYGGRAVAQTYWYRGQTSEAQELALLKELAEKHGKVLRKKPAVKSIKTPKV